VWLYLTPHNNPDVEVLRQDLRMISEHMTLKTGLAAITRFDDDTTGIHLDQLLKAKRAQILPFISDTLPPPAICARPLAIAAMAACSTDEEVVYQRVEELTKSIGDLLSIHASPLYKVASNCRRIR